MSSAKTRHEKAKENKSRYSQIPISEEEQLRVKGKVLEAYEYLTDLLVEKLGLFKFRHPFSGFNLCSEDSVELRDGVGTGHKSVVFHISKHFSVFNNGNFGQALQAHVTLTVKDGITRDELLAQGLDIAYTENGMNLNKRFQYSTKVVNKNTDIHIKTEEGMDSLLSGEFDEMLLHLAMLSFARCKEVLSLQTS